MKETFIKLVFNSFKIKNCFSYKDPIPDDLKSFLVYKFTCASCSTSYISETYRHFKTKFEEYSKKDNKSHKSIKLTLNFELKIKEASRINWRKPNLNAQQNNLALILSL